MIKCSWDSILHHNKTKSFHFYFSTIYIIVPSGKEINLNSCEIFLFSNRNCCDSKHFVSLLQNIFIKMSKYFLVGFLWKIFRTDCNAGDRGMMDVDDEDRPGPHPQSPNGLAVNYTILDEERTRAWNIGIDKNIFP